MQVTISMSHFIEDGQWNESLERQHAPTLMIPQILNTKLYYQEGVADEAVWKLTDNGSFSCAIAWEIGRRMDEKTMSNELIWHKHILSR